MEGEKNRDPKLCNNAVRDFWDNERMLVKEGQGTRDWNLQQQVDIMNYKSDGTERKHAGVPKDENGIAYEGHHMKSAEEYPELQGQGSNIQALTRDEHLKAHEGNFQNSTNGYYNPETGETSDPGNPKSNKPEPSKLSQPYVETDEYKIRNNSNEVTEQLENGGQSNDGGYDYYNGYGY